MCNNIGIRYVEFSHLYTQWGAKHPPKIIATEEGECKRIFGWETDAAGDDYKNFIAHFLPDLVRFIEENELEKRCYFHISDEPHLEHLVSYQHASHTVRRHINNFPIIDALSNFEFFERGVGRQEQQYNGSRINCGFLIFCIEVLVVYSRQELLYKAVLGQELLYIAVSQYYTSY
ncbi:glycoside hydrolase domain-containing protein [Paenibacillus nasutitermitis]|uniref:Glycoside hydrolase 123 catalytic domain-containing protein n=1 Tax=Paenibacillus nasutitermitis TaxID=1652958 RepID=A0A916ZKW2_9BACL|nr:hypothetical protein GCM10010911_72230 [Paenibacillus nasutitermitis]